MRHRLEADVRSVEDCAEAERPQESDRGPVPEAIGLDGQIAALTAKMADLQDTLERDRDRERQELEGERDRERTERLAERNRADRITEELAELGRRFATSTSEARAREMAVQNRLDSARAELAGLRARPWWRRVAG